MTGRWTTSDGLHSDWSGRLWRSMSWVLRRFSPTALRNFAKCLQQYPRTSPSASDCVAATDRPAAPRRDGYSACERNELWEHRRSRVQIESLAQVFAVLAEAAEHGVMCCYLYAAFGLRSELSDGLPPDQTNAVKRWRDTILAIAVEEMSHLALVSNLMVALGAHPHLGRQNMPVPPGYHPADIRLALAPFDRQTLDHFIFLERPEGSGVADAASFAAGTHYVRETAAGRFFPAGSDYETIGGLYRDLAAALTKLEGKLGERLLFSGDPALQVGPETVSLPGPCGGRAGGRQYRAAGRGRAGPRRTQPLRAALSEQRQVVCVGRSTRRPKRRLGREGAPLGQRGGAPLFVNLAGDEMALLIEMVVDLGMN